MDKTRVVVLLLGLFLGYISCQNNDDLQEDGKIELDLYDLKKTRDPFRITTNDNASLIEDGGKRLAVITHGYLECGNKTWLIDMKDAILNNAGANYTQVIVVGWEAYATKDYFTSADKTQYVGKYVGAILSKYINNGGLSVENVHLIGHSLGSQVMGAAGQKILEKTGKLVKRISGLDPAGPLFEIPPKPKDQRLDKGDAQFVDIIHTNAGIFGYKKTVGHLDFYVNGGTIQNGCFIDVLCHHQRSFVYYIESIRNPDAFIGFEFSSETQCRGKDYEDSGEQQVMGFYANENARGVYGLCTNDKPPYGRGQKGDDCDKSSQSDSILDSIYSYLTRIISEQGAFTSVISLFKCATLSN